MAVRRNRIDLSMKVVFSVIIVAATVVCGGCKRQPTEPNQPQGYTPAAQPEPKPVVIDQTGPKKSLDEIIRQAQTWSPAFKPWIGKPVPDFTVTDIAGMEHKLSDYRGKHVVINFWATYCGACRLEIPHLIQLRNTIGADKLAILAISNETAELVKRFAAQQKINYTVIAHPGPLASPFGSVEYTPTNFLIDSQGRIKLATIGLMSADEIKAVLQAS